jgi:hypothetical protein
MFLLNKKDQKVVHKNVSQGYRKIWKSKIKKSTQPLHIIKVVLFELKSYFILRKNIIFIMIVFVKNFMKIGFEILLKIRYFPGRILVWSKYKETWTRSLVQCSDDQVITILNMFILQMVRKLWTCSVGQKVINTFSVSKVWKSWTCSIFK